MKYFVLVLIFIAQLSFSFAQDRINVVDSKRGSILSDANKMIYINGLFEHKGNTLYADSSFLYKDEIGREFFEGFGNVLITQPSGTVIHSDRIHYDATSQQTILSGKVKMVDNNSTLTTNYLTYNMRSKRGTYTGGGRIVSQGDTITSKKAYYFETTGDAYFREKVIVRTPDVKVYTDTMRYNSISRTTFFFGPTNIKGNKNENLYTEQGHYNTATGVADFNKNNLYTEGSRFLKGDSLHYDRTKGIGEAFRNVVFIDTVDKFYSYGGKGTYNQAEESILMTDKPYIITVIKNETRNTPDSLSNDSATDNLELNNSQDSTVNEKLVLPKDSITVSIDSAYMTADTLFSKTILVKNYKPLNLNLDRDGGALMLDEDVDYGDDEKLNTDSTTIDTITSSSLEKDSLITDSVNVNIKNIKEKLENGTKKPKPREKPNNLDLTIDQTLKSDSILRQQAFVPPVNYAEKAISDAMKVAQTQDTVSKKLPVDSIEAARLDTAKTRIVKAYYNVRLFKSDLQAVADSAYYGMQDSMFRFMGKPMIWSQGSQISADTIFMQIINQKMDNALMKSNAFMVNAVQDTLKFNQLKGRKITAFFKNNNIDRLYVDGNAENLVFIENEVSKLVTEMFHSRGGRIKIMMENKKITNYVTIHNVDQKVYPFKLVNQDNEILKGFIWRPQDRPKSKEDLLNRTREKVTEEINNKTEEGNSKTIESDTKTGDKIIPPENELN